MPKPASPLQWATDANYAAGPDSYSGTPTKVTPTTGELAAGWRPKTKPAAQKMNFALNLLGRWSEYVDAGALEGDHSIDGSLSVTGDAEIDGALDVGGTLEASDVYHTDQVTLRVNAASAQVVASGGPTYAAGGWLAGTSTGQLWYPISGLRTGERIKSWLFFLTKGSASGTVTATLVRIDSLTGASTTIGVAQSNSAASPGNIVLGQIGIDELVTGDTSYALVVTGGGTAGDTFRDVQVNTSRPRP